MICELTIVRGGVSDQKLKISPAEHAKEKVWLDTRVGKERMTTINRIINLYAPRTGIIPKPVQMCKEKLNVITLNDEDIPIINLNGHTLGKPAEVDERPKETDMQKKDSDFNTRMASLETNQAAITTTLADILGKLSELNKKPIKVDGRKKK